MGFSVLPTNIGGFNLGGTTGPLESLFAPTSQINNLVYPSDLGSNLAMGHAVIISAFDYTTGLGTTLLNGAQSAFNSVGGLLENPSVDTLINAAKGIATSGIGIAESAVQASNYQPLKATSPLATVSLFMPENLNVSYNSI